MSSAAAKYEGVAWGWAVAGLVDAHLAKQAARHGGAPADAPALPALFASMIASLDLSDDVLLQLPPAVSTNGAAARPPRVVRNSVVGITDGAIPGMLSLGGLAPDHDVEEGSDDLFDANRATAIAHTAELLSPANLNQAEARMPRSL